MIILKQYDDQRINTILNNLEFDMKKDEEYNYRDVNFDIKELCNNVDKVVEYVKNGERGKLYLNSNIWNICLDSLVQILSIYNLKLVGSERVTEAEEVVSINEYIKRECEKLNLDSKTTNGENKKHLYKDALSRMIKYNNITPEQAKYFYNHFVREQKEHERER